MLAIIGTVIKIKKYIYEDINNKYTGFIKKQYIAVDITVYYAAAVRFNYIFTVFIYLVNIVCDYGSSPPSPGLGGFSYAAHF